MNLFMRNKKIWLALLLVFIAPGILAFVFYMNPSWLRGLPTNKGLLIRPPVQMSFLDMPSKGKWHLTVWCPKGCDAACIHTLDEMARVRLALGRRLYQVDLWLLQAKQGELCQQKVADALKAEDVRTQMLSAEEQASMTLFDGNEKVFLADPNQYIVLEYAASGKASDVFQDLKRLLNTKEQA